MKDSLLAAVSAGDRDHPPPPHISLRTFALFLFFASVSPPWSRLSLLSFSGEKKIGDVSAEKGVEL